jgi:hypothetical protein
LLGFPEPRPRASRKALQLTLGLVFDRAQGLLVQVPWCLVGLVGLVGLGLKRLPVAVAVTVISFCAIWALNGTYVITPYGGAALDGRFSWTLIPISLPWAGLVLQRARSNGRSLVPALAVALAVFLYQGIPMLVDEHHWWNPAAIHYQPYPGWWDGLDDLFPQLATTGHTLGTPGWGLPLELLLGVAVVAATLCWTAPSRRGFRGGRSPGSPVPAPHG